MYKTYVKMCSIQSKSHITEAQSEYSTKTKQKYGIKNMKI